MNQISQKLVLVLCSFLLIKTIPTLIAFFRRLRFHSLYANLCVISHSHAWTCKSHATLTNLSGLSAASFHSFTGWVNKSGLVQTPNQQPKAYSGGMCINGANFNHNVLIRLIFLLCEATVLHWLIFSGNSCVVHCCFLISFSLLCVTTVFGASTCYRPGLLMQPFHL